jgi:Secreted trypsin-like serine protease
MKRIFILFLLCQLSFYGYSQKVNVCIMRAKDAGRSEWQILDGNYRQVIRQDEYPDADSVVFSLEAERRYYLQISISDIFRPGVPLYSVLIDNEHIMDVGAETEPGDYFYSFFTGTREAQTKIMGGTDAAISDFPWQIYLISGIYQCGGSIIAPGWVVTAAHCVKNSSGNTIPASSMIITAGTANPTTSGTKYYVTRVIPHESFNSTTLENDIALLKVSGAISCTDCKPIKLMSLKSVSEGYTDPGTMAWITGWGLTNVLQQTIPATLQKALIPIVSEATAATVWGAAIPSTDIMAGYLSGNKDACSGDSGGPMSVFVNGEYKLAGIVSWGSKNCDTYGGYTRVSDFEFWIRNLTGIYDYTPAIPVGDSVVCPGTAASDYVEELVSNALDYEWQLLPSNAGALSWNRENASVTWNSGFIGTATVRVRVRLSDSYSEWAERTVIRALYTKLLSQPGDTTICAGEPLSLILQTEGTGLNFNWYKDGSLFESGIYYSISWFNTPESVTGKYWCQATGLCGSFSTDTMNVVVYPVTVINSISPDITVNYGSEITLQVDAGGHNLDYQWMKNGKPIDNGNSADLVMQNVDARNIGLYSTVVSGTCGTLTSDSVYVYLRNSDVAATTEISVWPTVVADEVNVATSSSDKYEVRIISLSGNLMLNSLNCRYQTNFNLSKYPKGLYILTISNSKLRKSFKLVKE